LAKGGGQVFPGGRFCGRRHLPRHCDEPRYGRRDGGPAAGVTDGGVASGTWLGDLAIAYFGNGGGSERVFVESKNR
jgi:hypothetical protein